MRAEVQVVVCVLSQHVREALSTRLLQVEKGALVEGQGGISAAKAVCRQVVEEEGKVDRKSTRLNSSHSGESRMPSSA